MPKETGLMVALPVSNWVFAFVYLLQMLSYLLQVFRLQALNNFWDIGFAFSLKPNDQTQLNEIAGN